MNINLQEQAKKLAARSYNVRVMRDATTDGMPIYLLENPELPGCMAQGQTIKEAIANLDDARIDYILSLLEDGLPVPEPIATATVTAVASGESGSIEAEYRAPGHEPGLLDDLTMVSQLVKRHQLYEIWPRT